MDQRPPQQHVPSLASLSRNTSVISSSSSSSSTSSLVAPIRPRPNRSWSQSPSPPGVGRRARSPHSPSTPRQAYVPPSYLTHQLGLATAADPTTNTSYSSGVGSSVLPPVLSSSGGSSTGLQFQAPMVDPNRAATLSNSLMGANSRPQIMTRTRTSSAVKKIYSAADFDFGEPLGDGSYSTVSFYNCDRHEPPAAALVDHVYFRFYQIASLLNNTLLLPSYVGPCGDLPSYRPSVRTENHRQKPLNTV